jgi:hypothetical protein
MDTKCSCGGIEVLIAEHWECSQCGCTREVFQCKCGGTVTLVVGDTRTHWSCDKCERKGGFDLKSGYN